MSCGVGRRCSLDPELLRFWRRLAATAPIRPLAWEPPWATSVALEKAKRQKDKKKKERKRNSTVQTFDSICMENPGLLMVSWKKFK